ncbi:guanylate kinase, partial [Escherichia coli]
EYDYLLINDDFNTALADLQSIIRSEKLRLDRQTLRHGDLISKLLAD